MDPINNSSLLQSLSMNNSSLQHSSLDTHALGNELGLQGLQGEVPGVEQGSKADFGAMFAQALDNVNGLQKDANQMRERFEMGDRSVSVAEVMIAGQKSSLAFDATVQVRNKLVQAYQDIMNMPV